MKSLQISPGAGHLKTQRGTGRAIMPGNVCCKSSHKNAPPLTLSPLFNLHIVVCKDTNKRHITECGSETGSEVQRLKQITVVNFFGD